MRALPFLLLVGCAAPPAASTADLMNETTAGRERCVDQGDETRLFVVDWDATDASTFQARASRDVVFVRYDACDLELLDGCSDGSLAGRYGAYREPVFTSGADESFRIESRDELAAKLPLGVATLGGAMERDVALELTYHVSGTTLATRDEFYATELADNDRCAGATHVVASYNLGAFELATTARDATAIGASVKDAGIRGRHEGEKETVKRAGDLEACDRIDNHPCRVPIRLTLRPIRPGARPAPATAASPPPGPGNLPPGLEGMMRGMGGHFAQAQQKYMMHDGEGCLRDLDLADRADPAHRAARLDLRARCAFRAGKCDEGRALMEQVRRKFHRENDVTGLVTEETIRHEVDQIAQAECATAAGGGRSVQNSSVGLLQQIVQAQGRKDAAACVKHGDALLAMPAEGDAMARQMAAAGLQKAAFCAAEGGQCEDARRLYLAFMKRFDSSADEDFAEAAFRENVTACGP